MNTKTDKATARPWSVNRKIKSMVDAGADGNGLVSICDCDTLGEMAQYEANANAALIAKAVNEHAALCGVTEAAHRRQYAGSTGQEAAEAYEQLRQALSTLNAIRS